MLTYAKTPQHSPPIPGANPVAFGSLPQQPQSRLPMKSGGRRDRFPAIFVASSASRTPWFWHSLSLPLATYQIVCWRNIFTADQLDSFRNTSGKQDTWNNANFSQLWETSPRVIWAGKTRKYRQSYRRKAFERKCRKASERIIESVLSDYAIFYQA